MKTDTCLCYRCSPTSATTQCSTCGEEVRWGTRDGVLAWHHREAVDHHPLLGHLFTTLEQKEVLRQQREVIRYTNDGKPYTTAEVDISKDEDPERRRRRLAELRGSDPEIHDPIPAPEIPAHDVGPDDFPPRSGIRQIYNLVTKTPSWEVTSFKASRGPYLGASGRVLSISDAVKLVAKGAVRLDGTIPMAVAFWRDGAFDFAHVGLAKGRIVAAHKVNSNSLKEWIKTQ